MRDDTKSGNGDESATNNADGEEEFDGIEIGDVLTVAFENYPGENPKETLTGEVTEVYSHAVDMLPTDGSHEYWDAYCTKETDRVRVYKVSRVVNIYHPDRGTKNYGKLGQRAEVSRGSLMTDGGEEPEEEPLPEPEGASDAEVRNAIEEFEEAEEERKAVLMTDGGVVKAEDVRYGCGCRRAGNKGMTPDRCPEHDSAAESMETFVAMYEDEVEMADVNPRYITDSEDEVMTDGGRRRVPESGESGTLAVVEETSGETVELAGEVDHATRGRSRVYDGPDDETGHMEEGVSGFLDAGGRRISFNTASKRVSEHFPEEEDVEDAVEFLGVLVDAEFENDSEPEVMTDGGRDIRTAGGGMRAFAGPGDELRRCPECDAINNIFVNDSCCHDCGRVWGSGGEVLDDSEREDGAEIMTDGGSPICGYRGTKSGGPCQRTVARDGLRCPHHPRSDAFEASRWRDWSNVKAERSSQQRLMADGGTGGER